MIKVLLRGFIVMSILSSAYALASKTSDKLPDTPIRVVVDKYHSTEVSDPYRWLEGSDEEVNQWTHAQANYARSYLNRLPHLKKIQSQLKKWNDFKSPSYRSLLYRNKHHFVLKLEPPKNQPMLVFYDSIRDLKTEHVIVDPNAMDSSGTTAIDFWVPSIDGKTVAVSLSKLGSEEGTLHLFDTATGRELPETIERVMKPTAGGSVAWNRDGTGFYYTRYPHPNERPAEDLNFYQQIYFHALGKDSSSDTYSFGSDLPRIAEITLSSSFDGSSILATVANGDGGEYSHYVLLPNENWKQITDFSDGFTLVRFGRQNDLYLLSLKKSPRGKILRLSLDDLKLSHAKVFIEEDPAVIQDMIATEDALYVTYLLGGPTEIRTFDLKGIKQDTLSVSSPSSNFLPRNLEGNSIAFSSESFTQPQAWYEYSPSHKQVKKTALFSKSPVDFSDIETKREFAKSKDGTLVPITLVSKKGLKQNSQNPTLLYGYGGYGISMTPHFDSDLHLWLEHGGLYVDANIRGGGEFGKAWHEKGHLAEKQNVFDDFIACAEHLIQSQYTQPSKLAIEGRSNGGLLMGAVMTQRPDLFQAVISHVGVYDMLRVETDSNGAFNVTEFGTVQNLAQFNALYAYSPFHRVKDGTAYPSVLLMTGANDGRVNPYHSKKMAARLQHATSSKRPVLLRIAFDGGHGMGRAIKHKIEEDSDVLAFLFSQLGMD